MSQTFFPNLKIVSSYLLKYYLWLLLLSCMAAFTEVCFKVEVLLRCGAKIDIKPEMLFSIIFIAPILEELVFRMGLTYNRKDFAVGMLFSIIGLVYWHLPLKLPIDYKVMFYILFVIIQVAIYALNIENKKMYGVWMSSILFGLLHISKYENCDSPTVFLLFINTIPQMISGYYLAKLRLEKGIYHAISLHMIINIIAAGSTYLLK